ncbi:hypothetical_protein [Leishmania infantum]|uniref:Hypothetical_protein n=1 Tax=Leishmania infantum TaxID=5671 RepID=A0A6L0XNB1_LEIIN|nr:hypothetical_protein [Leishmania infantum]SUZ43491.1 hypothetical_protein [Leishmania infantum]
MTSSSTVANIAAASTLSSRLRTPLTAASPYAQRALYRTSLLLFAFQDQSFTVVVCRTVEYTTETFLRLTDGAAAVLGCHIPSVGLYIEETTCNSIDLGLLAAEARASKENLSCCCVDHKEHVSCGARFQDVRAWPLMISEENHFSALEQGLHNMNLNRQLTEREAGVRHPWELHFYHGKGSKCVAAGLSRDATARGRRRAVP